MLNMTKELFIATIIALREQCDKDNKRARDLSVIYGSDINPNNNSFLVNIIFDHLLIQFPDGIDDITFFCYDQEFGRKSGKKIEELWEELVASLVVIDAKQM